MIAGILAALCLWFAWRALRRCRQIHGSLLTLDPDPLEQRLAESEMNLELNLARRNVLGVGRVAFLGGAALAFWTLATGQLRAHPVSLYGSLAFGALGWAGCREMRREIGSLAESWRAAANKLRRLQGVDQPKRTG